MRAKEKVDPYTSQMLLREAYDIDFGIWNHNDEARSSPLALIKMYPKEDPVSYGRRYQLIRRYGIYQIKEHFGLTISEFLQETRENVDLYLRLAAEYAVKSGREKTNLLNEVSKAAESAGR